MPTIKGEVLKKSPWTSKTGNDFLFFKIKGQANDFSLKEVEKGKEIEQGDFVMINYSEDEQGRPQIVTIEKTVVEETVSADKPVGQKVTNGAPNWDAKDKRMVRMNTLNRAVDMYVAGKIEKEEVIGTAQKFEDWVYGKETK